MTALGGWVGAHPPEADAPAGTGVSGYDSATLLHTAGTAAYNREDGCGMRARSLVFEPASYAHRSYDQPRRAPLIPR